jgi:hypothetical protein
MVIARLKEHLLLMDCAGDFRRVSSEVEVSPDGLLRYRPPTEGVIVERIISLVELVA